MFGNIFGVEREKAISWGSNTIIYPILKFIRSSIVFWPHELEQNDENEMQPNRHTHTHTQDISSSILIIVINHQTTHKP